MPKSGVGERFTEFMEGWAHELEEYLEQLLSLKAVSSTINHHDVEGAEATLVSKLTQHHKGYYTVKWALAHEDVLPFFSQSWATPLEKAYSWLTGWRPSTMFKLLLSTSSTAVAVPIPLTQQQLVTIEELRVKVKLEEEKVERDMERQHVALAGRKMVELARLASRRDDLTRTRIDGLVEVALKGLVDGLEKVVRAADCVRLRTLKGILEILTPSQCVAFFAASSALLIRLRQHGLTRERILRGKHQLQLQLQPL